MQWPDQCDTLKKDLPAHFKALIQHAIDKYASSIEEVARVLEVSQKDMDSILDESKVTNNLSFLFFRLLLALDVSSHEIEEIFGFKKINIRDTDFSVDALKNIANNELIRKEISSFFSFYIEFKSLKLDHFKRKEIDLIEFNLLDTALHEGRSYKHKFTYPDFLWQLLNSAELDKKYADFCKETLDHFIAAGFLSPKRLKTISYDEFYELYVAEFLLDDESILYEDEYDERGENEKQRQKITGMNYAALFWLSDVDAKEVISQLFEKFITAQNENKKYAVFDIYDASFYMLTIDNILRDWNESEEEYDPFGGWASDWNYFKEDSYVILNMEVPLSAKQVEHILKILGYKVEFNCDDPEPGKHLMKVYFSD